MGAGEKAKIALLRRNAGHDGTLNGEDLAGGQHVIVGCSSGMQEIDGSWRGTSTTVVEGNDNSCRIKEESVDRTHYSCRIVEQPPLEA